MRYKLDGNDFVGVNGKRRFTRALYGTNTVFRAKAGDLPLTIVYKPMTTLWFDGSHFIEMMIYLSTINLLYEPSIQYNNDIRCRHAVVF